MRIAYVLPASGAPAEGLRLAEAFERLGHELVVVAADGATADGAAGVRVALVDPLDGRAADLLAAEAGGETADAVRALLAGAALRTTALGLLPEFQPDLVYEHWAPYTSAGAGLARAAGATLIVDVPETAGERGFADTVAALRRETLDAADRVVTMSDSVYAELGSDTGAAHATLVPPAMDAEGFELTKPVRDALRSLLKVSDRKTVGIVADLEAGRDVASVLRAVAALGGNGLEPTVLVVGEGPDRPALETLADSLDGLAVVFSGPVPDDQVPAYLAAIDVAVAPASNGSPFSRRRLLQYLAAGVPVVAAESDATDHCVREAETGSVYRPGDVDGLAAAVGALLVDEERARALGAAGREHVAVRHNWDETAKTILGLVARDASDLRDGGVRAVEPHHSWPEPTSTDHFETGAYAAG